MTPMKSTPSSRGSLPAVDATAKAFFERAKTLSSTFFAELYARFVDKVSSFAPQSYCGEIAHFDKTYGRVCERAWD
jgi:hypothetical protein